MIRVNLFPLKDFNRHEAIKKIIILNSIIFVIILGGFIFFYITNSNTLKFLEKEIKKEKIKLSKLSAIRKKIKIYNKQKEILETKLNIINNLNSNRLYPSYLFYLLSKNIPDEVWIKYLKVSESKISLKGIALDEPTIVTFINNLKSTKIFKKIYLIKVNQKVIQKIELKEFSIDLYPNLDKFKEIL